MRLVILGPPRTKKTSNRIVRVRGSMRIIPSAANVGWTKAAVPQLRSQARQAKLYDCLRAPQNCRALIYRDAKRGDCIGYLQAICDALEAAGVVENDRLIVSFDGSRMLVDRDNPRVEIELAPCP